MSGSEWKQINGNEWRRHDGVSVRADGSHWQAFTATGTAVGARLLDSQWPRRLCDHGAFEPDVLALFELPDAARLPALQDAIRHLHGLEAAWLESVPVHEKHEGATVWEGEVQVFAVQHPKATRVCAWSHETEGGTRRFHAVLGAKPVDGSAMAVRTAVLAGGSG